MLKALQTIARFSSVIRIILLLTVGAILQGCPVLPVEKTDLSEIEVGSAREKIESMLGSPVSDERVGDLVIAEYVYNRGSPWDTSLFVGATIWNYVAQRGLITFIFNKNGKSIDRAPGSIDEVQNWYERRFEAMQTALQSQGLSQDELHKSFTEKRSIAATLFMAERGNPEAQFLIGAYPTDVTGLNEAERWIRICRAAHQRHAPASRRLANYYRKGLPPVRKDIINSYAWYELALRFNSLAAKVWPGVEFDNGNFKDALKEQLSPAQLAAARELAADWEPNPSKCES